MTKAMRLYRTLLRIKARREKLLGVELPPARRHTRYIAKHIGADMVYSFKRRLKRYKRGENVGFNSREKESIRYKKMMEGLRK